MEAYKLDSEGPPLKPADLARAMGCSRAVVDAGIKAGTIPALRLGRRYFIPARVAHAMVTSGRIPAETDAA